MAHPILRHSLFVVMAISAGISTTLADEGMNWGSDESLMIRAHYRSLSGEKNLRLRSGCDGA
jgi:hypothetical protein